MRTRDVLRLDEVDEVVVQFAGAGLHFGLRSFGCSRGTRGRVCELRKARDLVGAEGRGAGVVAPVGEDDADVVLAREGQELLEVSYTR